MSTVVVVQQRMASTRLPGKAMMKIGDDTVTQHVLRRAANVVGVENVVLAVPHEDAFPWNLDGWMIYRHAGDPSDLIGRYYGAVRAWEMDTALEPDVIVRLTGDCPFVPEEGIAAVIDLIGWGFDYAETRSDPSARPNGIDAQAFTSDIVEQAMWSASNSEREHVTPALLRCAERPTTLRHVVSDGERIDLDALPPFRVTIDTQEDIDSAREIVALCPHPNLKQLADLVQAWPEKFNFDWVEQ